MNKTQFTLKDLVKHLIKYSWLTLILVIIGAGGTYIYTNKVSPYPGNLYSASRNVLIKSKNNKYSSIKADWSLINSYIVVASDDKIISATKKQLLKDGTKISEKEIKKEVSINSIKGTLFIKISANSPKKNVSAKLVNVYSESFAKLGPTLVSSMPKPILMSKAQKTKLATSAKSIHSIHKKGIVFGAGFGFVCGIIISLIIAIYDNYKKIGKSE
ncbi:capsular polysaccharide biosynthesis protein [Oenococcus oeni]|uniref:capsular polysaccharide biosynthesis protein n=2 Tax=Oenococcus oeni TaxID=1247 RepID=UPI000277BC3E|nr:capsular polysaccharide biosynthesis protein [Oenococcus oeni]AWW98905.1 capsular biosynthesis protein [Oenococcus oeni]EJO01225.1 capsular polysaccharide biosynthesis protein [Oenococcus oeni AWRIB419]KEK02001.1 capsular biosynthesis protein [Oenococcus oeni]KER92968.1 capsular biosynthesis protein [Oenococcus oeni]KER94982.1 capsular biosynthesis protein [Oenococcus oeni]